MKFDINLRDVVEEVINDSGDNYAVNSETVVGALNNISFHLLMITKILSAIFKKMD